MNKAVIILSGGLDSTVLLYKLQSDSYDMGFGEDINLYALTFDYGQRHKKEIECAKEICDRQRVRHKVINLPDILKGSALTSNIKMPEEHYTHENQKLTVVPNRNMIMLSLAAGYAESIGANKVYYAAHANDRAIYWDCRKDFLKAINKILKLNDICDMKIEAPFIYSTKADIVKAGLDLGVPFEKTWSCYKGGKVACGKCGTCQERLEAFKINNAEDRIKYGKV
jgi:7-cyano-7-deazaguanine synthase